MDSRVIASFANAKVVVLGDVMLDRFVYGRVDRISPEAPIPVLLQSSETRMLGGAANVARNIRSLGGQAVLVGVVGEDGEAEMLDAMMAEDDGLTAKLLRIASHPTTVKTRFVCENQQILRLDAERHLSPDDALAERVHSTLREALDGAGALVLSDYGKGLLDVAIVSAAIEQARAAGVAVIVDPKKHDLAHYAGASIVTPNAREAMLATGVDPVEDAGGAEAARAIVQGSGIGAALVTRGAAGMTLYAPADGVDVPLHLPAEARQVFDVSGAGDTVVAVLALMVAAGQGLAAAAQLANRAAGLVVAKPGTATVSGAELASAMGEDTRAAEEARTIVTPAVAAERAARWQAQGLRVGFANGCFDLIHPGHVKLLERARAACDRLIVALNSDASVARLKGPSRPLQNEQSRAAVMAAIRSVDLVTSFGEDTPLELIRTIRPDVLVKGADYTVDTVVGADLVMGWGGEVALIPLEEGQSTTRIVTDAGSAIDRELGKQDGA